MPDVIPALMRVEQNYQEFKAHWNYNVKLS